MERVVGGRSASREGENMLEWEGGRGGVDRGEGEVKE